jgi:hypothetical protein
LVALTRWAAGCAAAAVVFHRATFAVAVETRLHTGVSDTLPTEWTLRVVAAFRAERRGPDGRATELVFDTGRSTFTFVANTACIADDRLTGAVDTGFAWVTVRQTGTAKRGGDTNAVAAFFLSGVATVAGAAREFERFAADARVLIALARGAAGGAPATVVGIGAAGAVTGELALGALSGYPVQTGGGRTSQDGSSKEALENRSPGKPSGQRARQCVKALVVHRFALLIEHILVVEVRPILLDVGQCRRLTSHNTREKGKRDHRIYWRCRFILFFAKIPSRRRNNLMKTETP